MWETVDPALRAIIERVCTRAEIDMLKLIAEGHSERSAARRLDLSRSTARDRLASAERKIRAEVAAMRGYGNGPESSPLG